jgi:NitT/TauT family transport system ATP-binding protein
MAAEAYAENPSGERAGIGLESVSFAYNGTMVLEDINLTVREGEMLSLLGPSGSGKTTLLRLAAGVEKPLAGHIFCRGKPVSGPGIDRGMVFQDYSLFPWMNLVENLVLAIEKSHPSLHRRERRVLAEQYLTTVGLTGLGGRYPFELSGGMQQRVAIARALAAGSRFLLMDNRSGRSIRSTVPGSRNC